MTKKYYINGWRESRSYFFSFRFTEEERERLNDGDQIEKDGNVFVIREEW